MIAILLLSGSTTFAQIKNKKTESLKIYGNCGMCKTKIEKAGTLKNVADVSWNKDNQMAMVSFDSLKTSKNEILKRVALAGYDSDTFLAPDDTYANLPGCCQYDRPEKSVTMSNMDMSTTETPKSNTMDAMKTSDPLSPVFTNYFSLKDALVATDLNSAKSSANKLSIAINDVKMDQLSMDVHMVWMKSLDQLKQSTAQIASAKNIEEQRKLFGILSENLYPLMKASKQETPTYYQHCPMANDGNGANWLSKDEKIKNPFYGSKMMGCGKTVETIK